jgi:hypothetical protein
MVRCAQSIHEPHQAPQSYIDAYTNWTGSKTQRTVAAMLTCLDDGIKVREPCAVQFGWRMFGLTLDSLEIIRNTGIPVTPHRTRAASPGFTQERDGGTHSNGSLTALKNVTGALAAAGVADETLIIFTADNGGTAGSSNYPLKGEKHSIFEGGVRGAAFASGYGIGANASGTKTAALMHGADWLPTLLGPGVAGGSTAGTLPLDGVDQWPAVSAGAASSRSEVVYGHEAGPNNCGLRNGSWKLLRAGGDKPDKWDPPGYGLRPAATAATAAGKVATEGEVGAPPSCDAQTANGTCYPGDDIRSGAAASAAACCAQCAAEARCVLWLWHTGNRKCFLKSKQPSKAGGKAGDCVVGGLVPPGPTPRPTPPAPTPTQALQLFDLAADPYEHANVAAAHPQVVTRMLQRLAVIDEDLHHAVLNASCPPRTPFVDPVLGPVWMPWCV